MALSADAAYLLGLLGALLIVVEFVRPGRVLPGVAGGALLCWCAYQLWGAGATRSGSLLLACALVLFGIEAMARVPFVAGLLAIACCGFGGMVLLPGPITVSPKVSWGTAGFLGLVVLGLSSAARRARRNKRVDL